MIFILIFRNGLKISLNISEKSCLNMISCLSGNVIFHERSKGIGILINEDAISFGVTGPTGRASGFSCDVSKHEPYSAYDRVSSKKYFILKEIHITGILPGLMRCGNR